MLAKDDDDNKEQAPDAAACQLLKIWINRKIRQEKGEREMERECDETRTDKAYLAGRMMAVYAAIQREAIGKELGARGHTALLCVGVDKPGIGNR